jgi:hypothetical protein
VGFGETREGWQGQFVAHPRVVDGERRWKEAVPDDDIGEACGYPRKCDRDPDRAGEHKFVSRFHGWGCAPTLSGEEIIVTASP